MKNHILVLSALVTLTACQVKELNTETAVQTIPEGKTVELTVLDDVKSSYQEGAGVNIEGTENIAVLYAVNDTLRESLKATPAGSSVYTFTIPGGVEPDEMFYGVMPYSSAVAPVTDAKCLISAKIFPVQYPSATSFDPHYDFLVAEGFNVEGGSATISKFRRIVSPLRMKIQGLPAGSKIRTAEIALEQGVSEETCIGLVGEAKIYATDNYRKSAVLSLKNPGNSVSAVYPDGLEASSGEWNVWYVVNPATLYADSKLTVRVSVDTATFTKVITLPSTAEIRRNELSQFSVDMGSGDVDCQTSVTFDFSKEAVYNQLQSSTALSIKGSDGKNYTLNLSRTKCSRLGEDGFPCTLQLTSPSGTGKFISVPFITGKDVVSVRMFAQIKSASTESEDSLVVKKNSAAIAKANVNMNRTQNASDYLGNTGGVAELNIPEKGATSLSGGQIQATGTTTDFSAMTIVLRDKIVPVYDANDYLSIFEAGLDIEIGGKVFNIETTSHYTTYKMSEIADLKPITNSFESNGLVFIDNDDDTKVMSSTGNILFGKDAVIIGRYKSGKGQPRVKIDGAAKYMQIQGNLYLLNMQLEHNSSYCFFTSKSGYSNVYTQDCTLLSTDSYGHGFIRLNGAGVGFKEAVMDNCVFVYGGGSVNTIYCMNHASGGNTADNYAQLTKLSITNCVFIPKLGTAGAVKTGIINTSHPTAGAAFILEGNSFYGMTAITPKAILNLKSAKSISIKNNVFYSETTLTSSLTHQLAAVSGTCTSVTITGNWMNKYETGGFSFMWEPSTGNYNTATSAFFKTDKLSEYYMPVDTTVVTTEAGASYETKLWKTWN